MQFTKSELKNYSCTKFLSETFSGREPGHEGLLSGLELEISDCLKAEIKKRTGNTEVYNMLPIQCLAPLGKAINATSATSGGFLVDESLQPIVSALRPASVLLNLGAQTFEGLRGDLGIPSEQNFPAAAWLSENAALPDQGDFAFAKTVATPKRLATMATLSRNLIDQNSAGLEGYVRASLRLTMASALDKAGLSGNGLEEPLGLLNNAACNQYTFGAACTRAKLIAIQDSLTSANVGNLPQNSLSYVTSPTVSSKLMNVQEASGTSFFLWRGSEWNGTMCGLPAVATSNVTNSRMTCGDFSKLAFCFWSSGISVMSDPFSLKRTGLVEYYGSVWADVVCLNPANFTVSTDSAAQ